MKEYKVISPSLGLRKRAVKLENLVNQFSKERWDINTITENRHGGISFIVFEREKNR